MLEAINGFINTYFQEFKSPEPEINHLIESMKYSATNGGKRFRPQLTLMTGEALGLEQQQVLPFAVALEFIHTYSLIHDDLPCMDNDDERRGLPTNHKVYGEDFALLTGDSLLTESFCIIPRYYTEPTVALKLTRLLAERAGVFGMVGGQAIDLKANPKELTVEKIKTLHLLKTGQLIQAAVIGPCYIANLHEEKILALKAFGEKLGLAFQIADDLLDYNPEQPEPINFVNLLGVEGTNEYLQQLTQQCLMALEQLDISSKALHTLCLSNASRNQ